MCFPPLPAAALLEMQSTPNYLWSTEDLLGQGATACVYKARNKVSGGTGGGGGAATPKPRFPSVPSIPPAPRRGDARAPLCSPSRELPGCRQRWGLLRVLFSFFIWLLLPPPPPRHQLGAAVQEQFLGLLAAGSGSPALPCIGGGGGKKLFWGECPEVLKTPSLAICIFHANTCQG